jgi:hypothetical protein
MTYHHEALANRAFSRAQAVWDAMEPPSFYEDEEEDMEEEVPLDCRRMAKVDHYGGNLQIVLQMNHTQIRQSVMTLMECLPDDKRAALVEELSELT